MWRFWSQEENLDACIQPLFCSFSLPACRHVIGVDIAGSRAADMPEKAIKFLYVNDHGVI